MYKKYDIEDQLDSAMRGEPLATHIEVLAEVALDTWFARVERAASDGDAFLNRLYALPDPRT